MLGRRARGATWRPTRVTRRWGAAGRLARPACACVVILGMVDENIASIIFSHGR